MQSIIQTLPPAFNFIPTLNPPLKTLFFHKTMILILTFLAYASFHASRKPPSIVKNVLGDSGDGGWPPFSGPHGTKRLGELDLAFLSAYAIGMYFSGHVADRVNLRFFLVFGMMASGFFTSLFGLGYWLNVHSLWFYVCVQILCGLFQSIGWPCVVAVVGNWFEKQKRGVIMGVWNSHTSVGNIIGSVVASGMLELGWGWSFLVPGLLLIVIGFFVFLFLVVSPHDLGFEEQTDTELETRDTSVEVDRVEKVESEEVGLLGKEEEKEEEPLHAIGFLEAWRLPGVAMYALCLFFSKLVAYTFLYWLPFYIRHTAVAGMSISHKMAGILSTIFDIGGVFGGISAGYISDKLEARAVTSIIFLSLSIPVLILYRIYGSLSKLTNIGLMFLSGLLVNGPYSLITTAVAADLGTQESVKGNKRALATVTAIIDGTGSVGAALGPLLAGYISTKGWNSVFSMLVVSLFLAALFLVGLAKTEIKQKLDARK